MNNFYIQGAEISFSKRVVNEKVKLMLPVEFEQMEKRYVKAKYPAYSNKNAVVLTNKDTTVNFMFDFKDGSIEQDQLEELRDEMLELVQGLHPSHKFLGKAAIDAPDFKVEYFEIVIPALDKDIYNFMYFFEVDENLVIAAFNCFDDEKDDWRPVVLECVQSLKLVKKK